ncbi:SIR2 family NAD-dependent protein deacylase [Noviherbaspirillum autotrophicum]|uniref:protein acetyllysine N-acetyltransferase n=1 Tax=Noviherbaspirillum autotrophicum TaxID=709839 RepID=A0A0C1Y8M8_9BURK|nr:Sir2 family NAD-dependent protein deacetylase [Noviherbaspirillum autotrophicum]KIF83293.1 NAD-dependent deacetylase [Noviherbaspirillum autotrophicum]
MNDIQKAAWLIEQADSLLITAGAGMGVDSGLPDFRGNRGFWRAYPALGRQGLSFESMANPATFTANPRLAWGFYGHRLQLYRDTVPHAGFRMLLGLAGRLPHGAFVYTSNVDGQFQKAGFDAARVVECHGSIHYLQCLHTCSTQVWPADKLVIDVDETDCLLRSPLPLCARCRRLARPNILMFNDWAWLSSRADAQQFRFDLWHKQVQRMIVIELGAGIDLPTIRRKGQAMRVPMIRINPTDATVHGADSVGLEMGALEALTKITNELHW